MKKQSITLGFSFLLLCSTTMSCISEANKEAANNEMETIESKADEMLSTEKDLVERKIEDKIADIDAYLSKIDSTSGKEFLEMRDDLSDVRFRLQNIAEQANDKAGYAGDEIDGKLELAEDELMQIEKELEELNRKKNEE